MVETVCGTDLVLLVSTPLSPVSGRRRLKVKLVAVCWRVDWRVDGGAGVYRYTHSQASKADRHSRSNQCQMPHTDHSTTSRPLGFTGHAPREDGVQVQVHYYTVTGSQAGGKHTSILLGTTIRCNGASTLLVATTTLILTTWTMDMVSQRFLGGSSFWSRYTTKQGSRMGPPPADHLVSHHRTGSQGGRTGSRKGASTLLAITHCKMLHTTADHMDIVSQILLVGSNIWSRYTTTRCPRQAYQHIAGRYGQMQY